MSYFHHFKDLRGSHIKFFSEEKFNINEVYSTISHKNVIRGFHSSLTQDKIIQVLNGKIEFIYVTIQNNTPKIEKFILTNESEPITVPIGAYIGYCALTDNTIVAYLAQGPYEKDKDLALNPKSFSGQSKNWLWSITEEEAIISNRDLSSEIKY